LGQLIEREIDRMAREAKVVIRLVEEKKDEFQELADQLGMSMSSLGSFVIGQWIYQQKQVVKPMLDNIGKVVEEAVKTMAAETDGDERTA